MKNLIKSAFFFGLLVVAHFAQAQNIPSDGVVIRLDNYTVEAKADESLSVDFKIVRSKFYQKQQTPITLTANAPEGIEATLSSNPNKGDTGKLDIKVAKTVKPGKYTITIQKDQLSRHKVVGTIITLAVSDAGITQSVK
ncbi:MAG: hypothetical protein MUE85_00345 [Microscillaceae bacterium]|jgi:hypothetical protein|nr:hypothetical protein [Microscillaceae bacterium]